MARPKPRETDRGPAASWSFNREIEGTDRTHKGWFIDAGLDADLDDAAGAAGWQHAQLTNGDNKTAWHWLIPSPCPLFVLINSVPYTTVTLTTSNNVAHTGLRCYWGDKGSSLAFQALHPALLEMNYTRPIIFQAGSYRTEEILTALLSHNAVLDRGEEVLKANGTPRALDFWDIALPIVPGEKIARTSKAKENATSNVIPPISGHPATVDVEYLRAYKAPPLVRQIQREIWPEIVAWADVTELKAKYGRDAA